MGNGRPSSKQEAKAEKAQASGRLSGIRSANGNVDWGDALPERIASLVVATTRLGGLASFGKATRGDALAITIFLDDERETVYINGSADLDAELEKLILYVDALG